MVAALPANGSKGTPARVRPGKPRVLIAEDDEDVAAGLQWMLSKRFDVSPQASTLAALRRCTEEIPDLIVADYQLPDFNGIDLLRIVRAATGVAIPAIMISANAERGREALQNGFHAFLPKPLREADLLATIERILETPEGEAIAAAAVSAAPMPAAEVVSAPRPAPPVAEFTGPARPRVLVVEDDEDLRTALSELLGPRYEIESMECVRDGVEGFAMERPDVLVLDFELPDGTGLRLLEAVRKYWGVQPPSVIVSAHHDRRAMCLEAGCSTFLEKPFQAADLVRAVERALGRASKP